LDGGNDHKRLDRDEVDAHEGDAHPGVDDDALVENTRSKTSTCLLVGLVLSTTTPDSPHTPIGKSHQHHARPLPRVSDDLSRARTFAVGKTLPKVGCLQGHLDTLV